MTNLREAAQQALEAMSSFESGTNGLYEGEFAQEMAALKAALAEPVQEPVWTDLLRLVSNLYEEAYKAGKEAAAEPVQEPVAWASPNALTWELYQSERVLKLTRARQEQYGFTEPLYAAPPQRKPLSEDEIKKLLIESAGMTVQFSDVDLSLARAIERAHGIK